MRACLTQDEAERGSRARNQEYNGFEAKGKIAMWFKMLHKGSRGWALHWKTRGSLVILGPRSFCRVMKAKPKS